VDTRDDAEAGASALDGLPHLRMPSSTFDLARLPGNKETAYLFCCARGIRSRYLALHLRESGYPRAYSLRGGLRAQELLADATP
jgi:rhodanese-related sulfurtransferase